MPGVISENYLSRSFIVGRQRGRELVYDIVGTEDEDEVLTLLEGEVPASYQGLALEDVNADPLGGGVWKGIARYVKPDDDPEFTFDTGGGTTKITQALSTIASYVPAGATAPNLGGAIGWDGTRVQGIDVVTPIFNWTETYRFTDAEVNDAYKLTLRDLTGRVNDDTFRFCAAGECQFIAASGSKRGDEKWSITFRFAAQPNQTGLTVGSITSIDKLGWDYMDVLYQEFEDTGAFMIVSRPTVVRVLRVNYFADFAALNIGP